MNNNHCWILFPISFPTFSWCISKNELWWSHTWMVPSHLNKFKNQPSSFVYYFAFCKIEFCFYLEKPKPDQPDCLLQPCLPKAIHQYHLFSIIYCNNWDLDRLYILYISECVYIHTTPNNNNVSTSLLLQYERLSKELFIIK